MSIARKFGALNMNGRNWHPRIWTRPKLVYCLVWNTRWGLHTSRVNLNWSLPKKKKTRGYLQIKKPPDPDGTYCFIKHNKINIVKWDVGNVSREIKLEHKHLHLLKNSTIIPQIRKMGHRNEHNNRTRKQLAQHNKASNNTKHKSRIWSSLAIQLWRKTRYHRTQQQQNSRR